MSYKIAVVGATGNVGYEMLRILHERNFPVHSVQAIASEDSVGKSVSFGDEDLKVTPINQCSFDADIIFSALPGEQTKKYMPLMSKKGIVIDNSSVFRMDPDVPLIVPEVNGNLLTKRPSQNIIANPNCSTIQMVTALKPLHDAATIKRIVVATYQSVSGGGKQAMDELFNNTKSIYVNQAPQKNVFTKQIAFNVIPHIDTFMDDGNTKEEWKMTVETKKILDPHIKVTATCVRVPVFIGHAEAVNVEFEHDMDTQKAHQLFRDAPGVSLVDYRADEGYVTPDECAGEDPVYVSRVRDDITVENGLNLWIVADNLRKGAALNAVQIAEHVIQNNLI